MIVMSYLTPNVCLKPAIEIETYISVYFPLNWISSILKAHPWVSDNVTHLLNETAIEVNNMFKSNHQFSINWWFDLSIWHVVSVHAVGQWNSSMHLQRDPLLYESSFDLASIAVSPSQF